jgi:hypothetical protein
MRAIGLPVAILFNEAANGIADGMKPSAAPAA